MLQFSILRSRQFVNVFIRAAFSSKITSKSTSSSSSSSDSDDERKLEHKDRSKKAREKLHLLLTKMLEEDTTKTTETKSPLPLTKARDHRRKRVKTEASTETVTSEIVEKHVVKAVQDVAESLGGNVKTTESELLQKLLNPIKDESQQPAVTDLVELFKDMQIDRETKTDVQTSRAEQVRQLLQSVKPEHRDRPSHPVIKKMKGPEVSKPYVSTESVNLHIDERLGVFNANEVSTWENPLMNSTWHELHRRELELSVTHPPENYFQQMILWTKQGKLWRFPIDNEQDYSEEKNVYFTEHIFLEKHLEGWCPSKGPIRYFMELVCVGLSKNSYLTAQMKKDHIFWFRDYFKEKKELLKEVGAFPPGFDIDNASGRIEAKK